MVDFRKLMTPRLILSMRDEDREAERVSKLADPWLAREVLRLVREARALTGIGSREDLTYSSALTMRIVPFLAKRLDATVRLRPDEEHTFREAADDKGRFLPLLPPERVADITRRYLSEAELSHQLLHSERRSHRAIHLLERHHERLNPVIVALSRAYPALRIPIGAPSPQREPLPGYHAVLRREDDRSKESLLTYCEDVETAESVMAAVQEGRVPAVVSEARRMRFEGEAGLVLEIRDQDDATVMGPVAWPVVGAYAEMSP